MRKLLADTSISNNPKILEELKKAGWKTTTAYRQEKGTRCYQFGVLYRFENSSVIEPPNHSICVTDKQVTHYATEKTAENKVCMYCSIIPRLIQSVSFQSSIKLRRFSSY